MRSPDLLGCLPNPNKKYTRSNTHTHSADVAPAASQSAVYAHKSLADEIVKQTYTTLGGLKCRCKIVDKKKYLNFLMETRQEYSTREPFFSFYNNKPSATKWNVDR